MPINQKQFDKLTEMGISLWQHKDVSYQHDLITKKNIKGDSYLSQSAKSLAELATQKFFIDILQSIDVSIGEISVNKDHLNLGLFNWYFSEKNDDRPAIYCINNNVFSPKIISISQSPRLKKQLWITLSNHLL